MWSAVLGFIMTQMMSGNLDAQHLNSHHLYLPDIETEASEYIDKATFLDRRFPVVQLFMYQLLQLQGRVSFLSFMNKDCGSFFVTAGCFSQDMLHSVTATAFLPTTAVEGIDYIVEVTGTRIQINLLHKHGLTSGAHQDGNVDKG